MKITIKPDYAAMIGYIIGSIFLFSMLPPKYALAVFLFVFFSGIRSNIKKKHD